MSGAGRRRYPSRSAKAATGSGFLPDHRPGVGLAGCPDSAGHHPAARDPLSGCDRSGFLASVASLGYPAFPAVRSVLPGFRDPVSDCSGQPFALLKRASSRTSSKIDAISEDVFVADREAQPSSHRNDRIHRSVHSYCGRHHRLELPARIARVTTPPIARSSSRFSWQRPATSGKHGNKSAFHRMGIIKPCNQLVAFIARRRRLCEVPRCTSSASPQSSPMSAHPFQSYLAASLDRWRPRCGQVVLTSSG